MPIIQWAIHRLDPHVELLEPTFRKRVGSVVDFLSDYKTGDMLIFVHRDAENASIEGRLREFDDVSRLHVVAVIPVRMSEAWILFDNTAIAKAASSPSRCVDVPKITELEGIADPKSLLNQTPPRSGWTAHRQTPQDFHTVNSRTPGSSRHLHF